MTGGGATGKPLVYYARGVDGRSHAAVVAAGRRVQRDLSARGVTVIDPVLELGARPTTSTAELVEYDLSRLRGSDAVFMDMSIPDRNFVGCSCELVYAYLWRIPTIVYVGRSGNQHRHWLQYHATGVHTSYRGAMTHLLSVLELRAAQKQS